MAERARQLNSAARDPADVCQVVPKPGLDRANPTSWPGLIATSNRGTTLLDPSNARSRRTRAALLASARSLLEQDGFEALTTAAVAERAGVTRRAVYLHFASRSELVADLFDFVSEAEGLAASIGAVWASTDAAAALEEWAAHLARFHPAGARDLACRRTAPRLRP